MKKYIDNMYKMSGYIQTTDIIKDIKKYHIKSFNVLSKDLTKPIFIVDNNNISFTTLENYRYEIKQLVDTKEKNFFDDLYDDDWKTMMICKTKYYLSISRGSIIDYAVIDNNFQILNWYYKSNFCFKNYTKNIYDTNNIKIISILIKKINIKKCVKNFKHSIIKTIKYKTKNNYIKGYNKN